MKNRRPTNSISQRRAVRRVMRLEALGERVPLDADGFEGAGLGVADPLPWFDPAALTYSFAPDGTKVAGQESQLFQQLGELGDDVDWQAEFEAAFNAWLTPLGIRTAQVTDTGDDIGVNGQTQGDVRFGDVRIAAIPLSQGVHATSVPHSVMVQGTWAGDILINANVQWNSLQELYAVALHEYGHVLGLGHSIDPTSPLFVHGVHDVAEPTAIDIKALQDLYAGISFEHEADRTESDELPYDESESTELDAKEKGEGARPITLAFDPSSAIVLQPTIGTSVRYTAESEVVAPATSVVFQLQPTMVAAEELENLSIALRATDFHRLSADVKVVDASGNLVETRVLHHGQGNVVVQAMDVESDGLYYVVITPSPDARPISQVGGFEIVVDIGPELRLSREVSEIQIDPDVPAMDLPISVSSSRLVHIHLESSGDSDPSSLVRAVLFDADSQVLTQVAFQPGASRSAPLTFLLAGEYTLRIVGSTELETLPDTQIRVFVDEVSIDVGPGVSDPTDSPYLPCDEPSADAGYCYVYTPLQPGTPTPSEPDGPVIPDYPWWWDYGYSCGDYGSEDFEFVQYDDPTWWDFYQEVCVGVNVPTTAPTTAPAPVANPSTPATPVVPVPVQPTSPVTPVQPTSPVIPAQPTTPNPVTPTAPAQPTTPNPVTPTVPVQPTTPVQPTATPTVPAETVTPDPETPIAPVATLSPMLNPANRFDVSNDSQVSPLDALLIINFLSTNSTVDLAVDSVFNGQYLDVSGDFRVSPVDILFVLNELGLRSVAQAEWVDVVMQPTSDFIPTTNRIDLEKDTEVARLF